MSRPFNQKAYDAFDFKNKVELTKLMLKKGYQLVGDIHTENYKKYDVKFIKDNIEISFENETRLNFIRIKNEFTTIHIPVRKKDTQADFYIVWKPELDEFFLIDKKTINEYKKNVVSLVCNEYDEDNSYLDSFIDIPKTKANLFKKVNNNWVKYESSGKS